MPMGGGTFELRAVALTVLAGGRVHRHPVGSRVTERGVDRGPRPGVVLEHGRPMTNPSDPDEPLREILVVHWPGHSYWSGRGMSSYGGTQIGVYEGFLSGDGKTFTYTARLTEFSPRPLKEVTES